jgi:RNA polymerase sigma-70 factor (sigma-E family)
MERPNGRKGIGALARVWGVEPKQAEFTQFYESARDDCLRIVLLNVGDQALAEDLVAEGFTRAWSSWRTVRRHPAPRAWVIRTALNAHVSWWRRHRRETALEGHDMPGPAGQESVLDSAVVAALRRLPFRQRQVIALRLLMDLDTDTTAQVLGISPGTVGVHLHRAIETLRGDIAFGNGRMVSARALITPSARPQRGEQS